MTHLSPEPLTKDSKFTEFRIICMSRSTASSITHADFEKFLVF